MARGMPGWLIAALVGATLCVVAAGSGYFAYESARLREARQVELKGIAGARVDEVARWRDERLREARLHSRVVVRRLVNAWRGAPGDRLPEPALIDRIRVLRENEGYINVLLTDVDGRILLAADPGGPGLAPAERQLVEQAVRAGDARIGEPLRCEVRGHVHLDVAAPILDDTGRAIAVIVLLVDPEQRLFPLVESWPTPSESAETLLVRRDGEDALLLNRLRHLPDPPLTVRFPLTRTDLPSVQAVTGRTGAFDGLDYRGVPVVAELLSVPGSDWFMVAKVDRAELYREVRDKARGTLAVVLLVVLLAVLAGRLIDRQRRLVLQEAALRADRERLATAEEARVTLYSIGDGVIATDRDGRVTRMNPVAERLTGWTEGEARGRPLDEVFVIVCEDTLAPVESPVVRVLREGVVVGLANHTCLVARDGSVRPIDDSGAPIRDPAGAIVGVILVFHDQTGERTAQRAADAAEAKFRDFFDNAPIGKSMTLPDGRLSAVNPAFCRMLGYSAEELARTNFKDITHPDDLEESVRCVRSLLAGEASTWTMDKRYIARDGRIVRTHVTTCLARDLEGRPLHFVTHVEDVSEQHRLAESLNREQQNFRALWEHMAAASCLDEVVYRDGCAVDYRVQDINPAFERLIGVDRARAVGALASDLYGTPIPFLETYVRVAETGEPAHFEAFFPPIGRYLQATASCPAPGRFSTVFTDVTERKRTEDALRASEQKFASAFHASPDAIFLTGGPDGRIVEVNPAAERLAGCAAGDLVGRTTLELGMWEDPAIRDEYILRIRRDGHVREFQARFRKASGVAFDAEISGEVVHVEGTPLFLSVIRDISERKRAEEERARYEAVARQQQKLESIGTLASGVAHEINNPLNVILNFGQLILDRPTAATDVESYARHIVAESERVALIVRNLLSFARQDKEAHSPARVTDIVERTLSLVQALLRRDQIRLEVDVPQTLPVVRCRSQQIQQVLMNLLTNARDALAEHEPRASEDKVLGIRASTFEKDGLGWVRLTVEDNGGGIPPDVAGRIFDPFFTTKARDKGTGLGLSISYGIVREHLGELWFETEPGKGTKFHVDLRIDNGWTVGERGADAADTAG